jgi:uncharacterized protein
VAIAAAWVIRRVITMKFQIKRSSNASQPYYWRIIASNGQVLASSETYVSKEDAKAATS